MSKLESRWGNIWEDTWTFRCLCFFEFFCALETVSFCRGSDFEKTEKFMGFQYDHGGQNAQEDHGIIPWLWSKACLMIAFQIDDFLAQFDFKVVLATISA